MRIKICGITRAEDAIQAADLGAWAVGLVFWSQSPRCVTPQAGREIVQALPPDVSAVGVFVDAPRDHVEAVAAAVGLTAVQLHGSETPEFARGLSRLVIKALPVRADGMDAELRQWEGTLVLLDAHDPVRRGGTGMPIDWDAAARVSARRPIVLAGGLGPENVAEAVRRVRPSAIDVSSSVESRPGIKDHGRMRALFAAVVDGEDIQ